MPPKRKRGADTDAKKAGDAAHAEAGDGSGPSTSARQAQPTFEHVLHAVPMDVWQRAFRTEQLGYRGTVKMLRQLSRECRLLVNMMIKTITVKDVEAVVAHPQQLASLLRLLRQFRNIKKLGCRTATRSASHADSQLARLLWEMQQGAPQALQRLRILALDRFDREEEQRQPWCLGLHTMAMLASALPDLEELTMGNAHDGWADVHVDVDLCAFAPLAGRLAHLDIGAKALWGAGRAISQHLSACLKTVVIAVRVAEPDILQHLSACTQLEELVVSCDRVSDRPGQLNLNHDSSSDEDEELNGHKPSALLQHLPLLSSCTNLTRLSAVVNEEESERTASRARELLEPLSQLTRLKEVTIGPVSRSRGMELGPLLSRMPQLLSLRASHGHGDARHMDFLRGAELLVLGPPVPLAVQLRSFEGMGGGGAAAEGPRSASTSQQPGVRPLFRRLKLEVNTALARGHDADEAWVDDARRLAAALARCRCQQLQLCLSNWGSARDAPSVYACDALAVLLPPAAAPQGPSMLGCLSVLALLSIPIGPASLFAACFAGQRLPLLSSLTLLDVPDLSSRHLGVIAALDAPRLSAIRITSEDGLGEHETGLALLCMRPQPVDSAGSPVALAVTISVEGEVFERMLGTLRAAGLSEQRLKLTAV